jgi:CcmD family protein
MDVTLKDLLTEIRNLSFLFYGYTVIWVIILGYVYTLTRREQNLRNQIEELKNAIGDEGRRSTNDR